MLNSLNSGHKKLGQIQWPIGNVTWASEDVWLAVLNVIEK